MHSSVFFKIFSFAFKYKFCVSSALFFGGGNDDLNVFVWKFGQTSLSGRHATLYHRISESEARK